MTKSNLVVDSKQADCALQLTQFSVNVAAEAMFTVSPSGCILSANESACERLEYSEEELVGMRVSDIDPHYGPELWPTHFDELRHAGKMTFETQHRTKNGRILDVEVSVAYFEFDGLEYCCSSVRDITQRKQAEGILRLQHDVLAQVAATSGALTETLHELCRLVEKLVPESISSVMLMDDTDGCLRFEAGPCLTPEIRAAFEPLTPGTRSGSCGAAAFLKQPVIVSDTRTSPYWRDLQNVVRQFNLLACWSLPILDELDQPLGTFAISHQRVCAPDDFHRQILETASHMSSIAICRKRFEQRLQLAHEELAHFSRLSTVGEMATSLAHELNQPLTAIVNFAYILEESSRHEHPDLATVREHASRIQGQALRAGDIVTTVRNLVKKTPTARVEADLNEIVQKSLTLLEPELRQNGISVNIQLTESERRVQVDSVQVQQVLVNLVRNAIDAMNEVRREERTLTLTTTVTPSNEIEVSVADTGPGLRTVKAETVFDAFHTTKQEGMGMGLAICRSIAKAHSGRLIADDGKRGGAIFRLTLPLGEEDPN